MRRETAALAVVAAVLLASFAGGFAVATLSDTDTVAVGIEVADHDPGNGTAGNPAARANSTETTMPSGPANTTSTPVNESTTRSTTTTGEATTATTTTTTTTTTATSTPTSTATTTSTTATTTVNSTTTATSTEADSSS